MGLRPGYKQTEVGVIPEDWDTKPCSALSDLITVGIVVRPTQYYVENGVPALRSANIREKGIVATDMVFISEESNALLSKSQVRAGDVLTVRTGYPGTSAVVPPAFTGANCIDILITRPSSDVCPTFLSAWINSSFGKYQVLRDQGGLAQQHFNVGGLRNLVVALPPSTREQGDIAEALTDADALIESLEQLLAKKRHLKQGAMQELLTGKKRLPGFSGKWEVKRLGELGTTFGGLSGKTKNDFGQGAARYITFMNIMANVVIDSSTFELVDVKSHETQNMVATGDLFFNGSSETPEEVGMCSYLADNVDHVFLNSFCFGFRFHKGVRVDGLYFAYYFRSQQGRELLKSLAQGATRYNLSKMALLRIGFPLPTPLEQTAIVAVLSDMDAEIAMLETKLAKARQLKQGMMQQLLTGRIRLI